MANGGWDPRFLSTTRGQVVALLWRAPRTVEELATSLGVTEDAIRTTSVCLSGTASFDSTACGARRETRLRL